MASLPVRYPALGERFTQLMDARGWTITQLAALAGSDGKGVTFATIARLRKGQTRPRPALLTKLAQILEVSESEIVGDDAPKSRKRGEASKLSFETKAFSDSPPRPNSLEGKMARIQAIRKLIDAADNLKPELQRLCDEVAAELEKIKDQSVT